jgi:hypothetical protein
MGAGAGDVAVEEFKALDAQTNILFYPCLEAYGTYSEYRPRSNDIRRALAMNYWHQGADGIYTFNWYSHAAQWEIPLFNEIGNPNDMHGKQMVFPAEHHQETVVDDYPHNWMYGVLPIWLLNEEVGVPLMVGEDIDGTYTPSSIDLRIDCSSLDGGDTLIIKLNGNTLTQTRVDQRITVYPTAAQILEGQNEVSITATYGLIRIEAVELHVSY